jgi:TonB-dependent starch-binding outer membrane protein SusC
MRIRIRINKSLVYKLAIAMWLVLLVAVHGSAQDKIVVSGTVKSQDNGQALPGTNVLESGTTHGTVTDADGKYSFSVSPNATLTFSFIGYVNEEVRIDGRTVVDVVMVPDVASLQEVVVVGYGTVKKSDVQGDQLDQRR